jgi:tetratricopeptide (TPR) repeat protein
MAVWSALLPRNLLEWRQRRQTLREIDHIREQEAWTLGLDDANFVNRALVSAKGGDLKAAEHYWQQALQKYPHFARTARDSLEVLLMLRQFDEAETLALEGRKREPHEPYFAGVYARVAESRGDREEAVRRWAQVRKDFLSYPEGYAGGASNLRLLGRLDEAEALIRKGTELFARNIPVWIEWARSADARRDWDEGIRRWDVFYQRFHTVHGDLGVARDLIELGRLEDAEERLRQAQLRFPVETEISFSLAKLAEQRGEKEEAARRWADTLRRFPVVRMGYQNGIRVLRELGRGADAERIAIAAINRFPDDAWPTVEYASIAHDQRDWEAAAKRWEAVRKGWPERTDGYLRGAEALTALGRLEAAAELKARVPG